MDAGVRGQVLTITPNDASEQVKAQDAEVSSRRWTKIVGSQV